MLGNCFRAAHGGKWFGVWVYGRQHILPAGKQNQTNTTHLHTQMFRLSWKPKIASLFCDWNFLFSFNRKISGCEKAEATRCVINHFDKSTRKRFILSQLSWWVINTLNVYKYSKRNSSQCMAYIVRPRTFEMFQGSINGMAKSTTVSSFFFFFFFSQHTQVAGDTFVDTFTPL